jgi:hypothetical protein
MGWRSEVITSKPHKNNEAKLPVAKESKIPIRRRLTQIDCIEAKICFKGREFYFAYLCAVKFSLPERIEFPL